MAQDPNKQEFVTQKEFLSVMMGTWGYIMLFAGNWMIADGTRSNVIAFCLAVVVFLVICIQIIRKRKGKSD